MCSVQVSARSLTALARTTTPCCFATPLKEARRGMKYKLFPTLDFLAYLKRIHVAYHPGRERTEVARRLILHMTAESTKKKFPNLQASWELLGYDAPAVVDVELVDGRKKRFLAEHYSRQEMQDIIDTWQYEAHLQHMKEHSLEKADDDE
ncbi:unnamed protein product [Symbiodinium necroappetens]|uniref:Uncharacterized protein n=2 Tax=Symbiodinium TaxID=2949 RepID=A0A813BJE7_9DINO|nr:hypothetical protein AK812_SmicGene4343 [Symbiodinium microadriaticum]CAE7332472.1 unnamed protein product [Symbiodinium sp. KB8]CAE7369504.1 unnamed protein product [Symbiodinium microadriaticum]CAE7906528.1 unnamed protein product [Symbiodinium necroappetens]